jgi:hypothetical protein
MASIAPSNTTTTTTTTTALSQVCPQQEVFFGSRL